MTSGTVTASDGASGDHKKTKAAVGVTRNAPYKLINELIILFEEGDVRQKGEVG